MSEQSSRVLRAVPDLDSVETTATYLHGWLRSRRALKASTVISYESTIESYLVPYLGDIELRHLLVSDIDAMYTRIMDSGRISVSTLARIHATLMSAMNAAVRSGHISVNPAAMVELPRATRFRKESWDATQVGTFLRSIEDDELLPLFALLVLTGLRRGEALGLQVRDLELETGRVRVERQVTQVGRAHVVGDPKSDAGVRIVAVDSGLANLLAGHLEHREMQLQRPLRPCDWLFGDGAGNPLRPLDITRRFRVLADRAGLPPIRLHDLRHSSASIGLAHGESLLEVSRRLGHSSIAITGDIYSEVSPRVARDRAERLAAQVWGLSVNGDEVQ